MALTATVTIAPALNQFLAGTSVTVVAKFADATTGAATDPTDPAISTRLPDSSTVLTTVSALTKISTGVYATNLLCNQVGAWQVTAQCTAPSAANSTLQFATVASGTGGGTGSLSGGTSGGQLPALNTIDGGALSHITNFPVVGSGTGTDASNPPAATLTSLKTGTVAHAGQLYVQNQSAATLQVILNPGTGQTVVLVAPGAGANNQGADWTAPPWFVGAFSVNGPAGAQFAATYN